MYCVGVYHNSYTNSNRVINILYCEKDRKEATMVWAAVTIIVASVAKNIYKSNK